MHALHPAHRKATWWLVALVGCSLALLLATPAVSRAEEANPNNYSCFGSIAAGKPEPGSEEQQVAYSFHCNGPITGYQLQSQIPVTGVEASPLVSEHPVGHSGYGHVLLLRRSSGLRRQLCRLDQGVV